MPTQTSAAVCREAGGRFSIEEVTLDDPRGEEVLVRIVATGICHTDMAVRDGQLPVPLPAVLGHEGTGVVVSVGPQVEGLAAGDRVLLSFNSCGDCPTCANHAPTYCYNFGLYNFAGVRPDGSHAIHIGDEPVSGNFFGQSAFAGHVLAHARNTVRLPESAEGLPQQQLAPLGCGLMTGAGAVLRSLKVRAGMPIAIFGRCRGAGRGHGCKDRRRGPDHCGRPA